MLSFKNSNKTKALNMYKACIKYRKKHKNTSKMTDKITPKDIRESQKGKECVPQGEFRHMTPEEELGDIVRTTLGATGKYHDISRYEDSEGEAGTRIAYMAKYGFDDDPDKIPVIIKVDLPEDKMSKIGKRNALRGRGTKRDYETLRSARHEALTAFRDCFRKTASNGDKIYLMIEDYFENSESLQKRVSGVTQNKVEGRPLNVKEFDQVFGQVIPGLKYLIEERGFYHQDVKPSNILIRQGKNGLEAKITDCGNSSEVGSQDEKPMPTSGGRHTLNPFLFEAFTGKTERYDEKSELFSLGATMFYSLTGKHMTFCEVDEENPSKNTAQIIVNGKMESMLDETGKIDSKKFKRYVSKNLQEAGIDKAHRRIIEKCLLSPLGQDGAIFSWNRGYEHVGELQKEFKRLESAPLRKKIMAGAIGSLAALAMGASILGYSLHEKNIAHKNEVTQASKYKVESQVNGEELEVDNNYVEVKDIRISRDVKSPDGKTLSFYQYIYPENRTNSVNPGERLSIYFGAKTKPLPVKEAGKTLEGKIYIEGLDAKNFTVVPSPYNEAFTMDMAPINYAAAYETYELPKDLPEGVHNLIIELHSPQNEKGSQIVFPQNQTLVRKVIPIQVGNPASRMHLSKLQLEGYTESMYFTPIKDSDEIRAIQHPSNSVSYLVEIPEEGFRDEIKGDGSDHPFLRIRLPAGTNTDTRMLKISALCDGKEFYSLYAPIKREDICAESRKEPGLEKTEPIYWWTYAVPNKNISETIRDYKINNKGVAKK